MDKDTEDLRKSSTLPQRESYKDSFIFDELSAVDPMEWVNIPKPIQQVVNSIKKCLTSNNKQLTEISEKLLQITTRYKKRLDVVEEKVQESENTVKETLEASSKNLQEFKDSITAELVVFKDQISKDLSVKFKSVEAKLSNTDEQIISMKKLINTLPLFEDIDKKIKQSSQELKEVVKEEISSFFIQPLSAEVKRELEDLNNNLGTFKTYLEVFKAETAQTQAESQKKTEESQSKLKKSIANLKGYTDVEMKKLEISCDSKLDPILRTLEDTNNKIELANRDFLKSLSTISTIQTELESQKSRTLDFNSKLETLKKKIEEERQQEDTPSEPFILSQESISKIPETRSIAEMRAVPEPVPESLPESLPEAHLVPLQVPNLPAPNPVYQEKTKKVKKPIKKPREDCGKLVSDLQKYIETKIALIEARQNKEMSEIILPLEQKIKEVVFKSENDFVDIKEKLAWLPMSFAQIKGKSPTEARIFTLEARLRAEENTRCEAVNRLAAILNSVQSVSPTLHEDSSLPPIRTISVTHDRNYSQESGIGEDSIRKQAESELSKFSNAFRPGKSNFLKKFSQKNKFNGTWRENSFLNRK